MFPLVTVIIPFYNSGDKILSTIKSILSQDYKNIELLLINDGSTDNTAALIKNKYSIGSIYQKNSKPAIARNNGISRANGKYIAFCDDDDHWLPDKISNQVELMEQNEKYGLCFTDVVLYKGGEIISESIKDRYIIYEGDVFDRLLYSNWITTSSVLVRTRTIKDNNIIFSNDPEILNVEDWHFWKKIAYHSSFIFLDKKMVLRYLSDSSYGAQNADKQFRRIFYSTKKILEDCNFTYKEIKEALKKRTKRICIQRVMSDLAVGRYIEAINKIKISEEYYLPKYKIMFLQLCLRLPQIINRLIYKFILIRHRLYIKIKGKFY